MKKGTAVNGELRAWTRGVSFTLAMGKRQVVNLICLHLNADVPRRATVGDWHRDIRHFVTAAHCLEERGLVRCHVWHDERLRKSAKDSDPTRTMYEVTEAGEHVIALLKLSGIYDEVAAELVAADKRKLRLA